MSDINEKEWVTLSIMILLLNHLSELLIFQHYNLIFLNTFQKIQDRILIFFKLKKILNIF